MSNPAPTTRVFVPQVPSRYDKDLGWVPTIELRPAEKFGEIVVLLPPAAARAGPGPCATAIREKLREQFRPGDWIVAVGDPSLSSILAVLATRESGGVLRLLKWDRMAHDYIPVEVKL